MKGFFNLPVIVAAALVILGAGGYFAYQQYQLTTASVLTQEDPQTKELTSQSAALKEKIASEEARKKQEEIAKKKAAEEAAKVQSTAPQQAAAVASGAYSRQSVQTQDGTFTVDMIAADLASGARVITDVGSDGNCADGCPAFSLAEYVARHGGYAGINGTYFCPPDYAQCAGQTNSFTLMVYNSRTSNLINEDKKDWTNAGAFFLIDAGNGIHFYNPASGYDGASKKAGIAMRPALVQNRGYAVNEGAMEPKENTKANRPFIGNKGSTVYIGVVRSATVPEEARALASLGFDNAIHLDSGGSTALYHNGSYLYGPGRKLPSAVIFAR